MDDRCALCGFGGTLSVSAGSREQPVSLCRGTATGRAGGWIGGIARLHAAVDAVDDGLCLWHRHRRGGPGRCRLVAGIESGSGCSGGPCDCRHGIATLSRPLARHRGSACSTLSLADRRCPRSNRRHSGGSNARLRFLSHRSNDSGNQSPDGNRPPPPPLAMGCSDGCRRISRGAVPPPMVGRALGRWCSGCIRPVLSGGRVGFRRRPCGAAPLACGVCPERHRHRIGVSRRIRCRPGVARTTFYVWQLSGGGGGRCSRCQWVVGRDRGNGGDFPARLAFGGGVVTPMGAAA